MTGDSAEHPSETLIWEGAIVVSAQTDVATAARLLRDRGVRHLVVKDLSSRSKEGIAGIVNGHDIAVTVVACERDPRAVTVADVMHSPTATGR